MAIDVAPNLSLIVNGVTYGGWKSIRVTQSMESIAGSFDLDVSDRWGPADPWPIAEFDECEVQINGLTVIDGYVSGRKLGGSSGTRTLSYRGRDRAAELVDCSVLVPDASTKGNKWTYRNLDLAAFAAQIAKQHDIKVSVQPGLALSKVPVLVAHPGETGFEALKRAAGDTGALIVSDTAGGIVITGPGTTRATALIEGVNIKAADIDYDASSRFHTYLVSSQPPGNDDAFGEATRVQAQATDADVPRAGRVLLIRPDKGMDTATARRRADWEARVRAAKSASATITVRGWEQSTDGALWKINTLARVQAPRLIGVDGDMLISQVDFTVDDSGGQITQLHIVRPDAFTPEPHQQAAVSGEGAWKELAKGAL